MATDVRTMNLSDHDDGMVNISTSFVPETAEKNVSENKTTMDSTPIADVMMPQQPQEMDMMAPPMSPQTMMMPQIMTAPTVAPSQGSTSPASKNPFNLTDDQMQILIVAVCTAIAISKPVQEKLVQFVPQFLNANGNRSLVGLGVTGVVAGVIFFGVKKYL